MLFNSIKFLIFFPIVTILYFFIPHRWRWVWLLAASYYFYMSWNPQYAILIALSTVITYLSGLLITKIRDTGMKNIYCKWVMIGSLLANLLILFFFKYYLFTTSTIQAVCNFLNIPMMLPQFDILLPVGISFYTFQALSYTIDVYRNTVPVERSLGKYALFVSFFPQLVAGPIERSSNLLAQIHEKHTFNYQRVKFGLQLMLWGLFQKMVIADRTAILVNTVYKSPENFGSTELIFASMLFAVQIYCDFAGYSNIAVGAAQVMGFTLMDNFRHPYFSTSIKDFWRRWHISLSTWFRDYLYIPLGGNRCSTYKKHCNVMVTFLVSGLWHGAGWNYIIWGGLHGFYQVLSDVCTPFRVCLCNKLHVRLDTFAVQLTRTVLTFILVDFAWIFFRADTFSQALDVIARIFSQGNIWAWFDGSLLKLGLSGPEFSLLLLSCVVLLIVSVIQTRGSVRVALAKQNIWFRWCVYYVAIFSLILFGVYGSQYNLSQFIYFQF